jgi:hypothetical protein
VDDKPAYTNQGIAFLNPDKLSNICAPFDVQIVVQWYKNNKLHRDNDQPAKISTYTTDFTSVKEMLSKLSSDVTYYNSIMYTSGHHYNIICYNDLIRHCNNVHSDILEQKWYKNDMQHRDGDQPAEIYTGADNWKDMIWYQDGVKCRYGDKPVSITQTSEVRKTWMLDNGTLVEDDYNIVKRYRNGVLHADNDQPAFIDKSQGKYVWCQNGKLHRDNNQPAAVITHHNPVNQEYTEYLYDNTNNNIEIWYQRDVEYTPA